MGVKASTKAAKTGYHHGDLRRALLEAAEAELTERGVEAFSLRGVAKRIGVSHAAPAHHFRDTSCLLTELAVQGYERFLDAQKHRQAKAPENPHDQLAASGLGYIDFATSNPALFRLMFTSDRPDRKTDSLARCANRAFGKLVDDISLITQTDPHTDSAAMTKVLSAWAVVHGLSDLLIADRLGRASFLSALPSTERDAVFSDMILRAIGASPK